jgi:hypothetical protein
VQLAWLAGAADATARVRLLRAAGGVQAGDEWLEGRERAGEDAGAELDDRDDGEVGDTLCRPVMFIQWQRLADVPA